MIIANCQCGKQYHLTDDKTGKKMRCSLCHAIMVIPALPAPTLLVSESVEDLASLPTAELVDATAATTNPQKSDHRATSGLFSPVVVIIMHCIFWPVGIYLLLVSKQITTKWKMLGVGFSMLFWASILALIIWSHNRLSEANALWVSGKKADAVALYRQISYGDICFIDKAQHATIYQRSIEHEFAQDNKSAAITLMKGALEQECALHFKDPEIQALFVATTADAKGNDRAARTYSAHYTSEQFKQIRKGMSYADVVKLLGHDGEEDTNKIEGETDPCYFWSNSDDVFIMVIFRNNRVWQKDQMGIELRPKGTAKDIYRD